MNHSLCLSALLAGIVALPALAQGGDMPKRDIPSLTVSGAADVHSAPDEATVRLGVSRQASSAREAQNLTNEVAQGILTGVAGVGVSKDRVQTSQLSLYPIYAQPKPGSNEEPKIVAYRAANTVSVRLSQLNLIGPVVDAGLKAGANQVEGVSFALRDDTAARSKALEEAAREARQKAATLARALDVKLVGLQEAIEGGVQVRPPVPLAGAMLSRAAVADVSTPVSPGEVTVHASVTLRYRIQDGAGK
jgi:uncharacterized protein YggE